MLLALRFSESEADFLTNIDSKHYEWNAPRTDGDGQFTMISLIPGALYRVIDHSTVNDDKGAQVRKEFIVKARETLELGDIVIEKPKSGDPGNSLDATH